MAELISVQFAFKSHSARSLDELVKKSRTDNHETLTHTALTAYYKILKAFRCGDDIIETDDKEDGYKEDNDEKDVLLDLFNEIANAKTISQVSVALPPGMPDMLRREFGVQNVGLIFSSALYSFDRLVDLAATERCIATKDPDTRRITLLKMDW